MFRLKTTSHGPHMQCNYKTTLIHTVGTSTWATIIQMLLVQV